MEGIGIDLPSLLYYLLIHHIHHSLTPPLTLHSLLTSVTYSQPTTINSSQKTCEAKVQRIILKRMVFHIATNISSLNPISPILSHPPHLFAHFKNFLILSLTTHNPYPPYSSLVFPPNLINRFIFLYPPN